MTNQNWLRELASISAACFAAGMLIGASDGAAMTLSVGFAHRDQDLGISLGEAMRFWAAGAGGIGAVVGALVGVPSYYIFFSPRISRGEFFAIAFVSLIGGTAFCFAFGGSLVELSWLATPCFTALASLLVWLNKRRSKL